MSCWTQCADSSALSPSGHPAVVLVPGEEPPSHVPAVERHFQLVCPQTSAEDPLKAGRLMCKVLSRRPGLEDEERLRVLVMMAAQELANGISYSGHLYAMTRAGRHLTPSGDLQEIFGGIEQVPDPFFSGVR